MKTERIVWLDIVRIVAIFIVVFAHSIGGQKWTPMLTTSDWVVNDLYSSLLRICVPLFVMVSGALLLGKIEPYKVFFTKRFVRVLIPWIAWTIIYLVWHIFYRGQDVSTPFKLIKALYVTFMSQFWFLPMITCLYLLTPMLRTWLKKATKWDTYYIIILWFAFYSLYPLARKLASPGFPMPVPFAFEHLGYFLLGYIIVRWTKGGGRILLLASIVLLSIVGNSVGTFVSYGLHRPEMKSYFWNNMSFFVIFATVAAFLLIRALFLKRKFDFSKRRDRIILTLSNASFGIFLVHVLIIEAMEKVPAPFPMPYPLASPIHAIIVYVISLAIIVGIQKTPLKRILAT